MPFSTLFRHVIAPVGCAFLALLGMEWWYFRTSLRPNATPPPTPKAPGWAGLLRHAFGVTLGGYLAFALIIGIFYFVLSDAGSKYLRQGFGLGAVLAFGIALPGLLAITAVVELWRRARGRLSRRPGSRG